MAEETSASAANSSHFKSQSAPPRPLDDGVKEATPIAEIEDTVSNERDSDPETGRHSMEKSTAVEFHTPPQDPKLVRSRFSASSIVVMAEDTDEPCR